MQDTETTQATTDCPICEGSGQISAFRAGISSKPDDTFPCCDCNGIGKVTPERAARLIDGRRMWRLRLQNRRSRSAEAKRLGISVAALKRFERGEVVPLDIATRILES